MTRSGSASHLGQEFNDFLFAPIVEAKNGMPLSVLSALARLDVDPWQEAAELTQLPGETAIRRLTALILALPDGGSTALDPTSAAARLIKLLPRCPRSEIPTHGALLAVGAVTRSRVIILYMMIFMAVALGAQCIIVARQSPSQVDNSQASAAGTVAP
jgi:hypothetical protein